MTIKISFGLRGENSPFMGFIGISSTGQSSPSSIVSVDSITANVSVANTNGVTIINSNIGENQDVIAYELHNVDYRDFRDDNNSSFISAESVVDYINTEIQLITDNIILRYTKLPNTVGILTVAQNVQFQYKLPDPGVLSIFWDESTFPSGVDVSHFDNRILHGTITTTGDYYLEYDKTNATGITTSTLHIEVI